MPVQYIIGMSISMYFSVVYKDKRLYLPKLNSTSASQGPERLENGIGKMLKQCQLYNHEA